MGKRFRVTDRTRGLHRLFERRDVAMRHAQADSEERPQNEIRVMRQGILIARFLDGVDLMGEEYLSHGDERTWVEL